MMASKKKYRMILSKIRNGGPSFGSEEQGVANLFGDHAKPADLPEDGEAIDQRPHADKEPTVQVWMQSREPWNI